MQQMLTKDARGFVNSVVSYLRKDTRSSAIPKVQALLRKVTVEAVKGNVANVETSIALNSREKTQLGDVLARLLGHPVAVRINVNPECVAGLRIQIGDWVVDTTIQQQLEHMKQTLLASL